MPPDLATGSGARAVLLNRVLLGLGFVGLFISGYLSYVKYTNQMPMCGASGGCMAVTSHPLAAWGGIPVAYFGLAGYAAITGLAALREITGRELSRVLVGAGLALSIVGFAASGYLMYVAFGIIGETCKWCLASATTMVLTFVGHAFLFGQATDAQNAVPRPRLPAIPLVLGGLLLTGTAIALIPKESVRVTDAKIAQGTELVPLQANTLGEESAPVTIVEFADFCCPTCRQTAMKTRDLVKKYPGKVRLVFRHFPLLGAPGHEMAYPLAIASEYAAKSGKFWIFHEAAMTSPEPPKTLDEVVSIARNVGLDGDAVAGIVDGKAPSDSFDRVFRDFEEAQKIGVTGTPSFFVQVKDGPVKKVAFSALDEELESGVFAAYVH